MKKTKKPKADEEAAADDSKDAVVKDMEKKLVIDED
jgi:hypothetical protein